MENEISSKKVIIKCQNEDSLHPHCPHGPTLLFYEANSDELSGFYACAAYRDKEHCSFHVPAAEVTPEHFNKQYDSIVSEHKAVRQKFLNIKEPTFNFCTECNLPVDESEFPNHLYHTIKFNISIKLFKDPTLFLSPVEEDSSQAQYFFDSKALQFFTKCFSDLNVNKVICIGAPRLHGFLRNDTTLGIQSFLLDLDHRFYYFDDEGFAWYNMCNNHFFDSTQQQQFREFVSNKSDRVLIFTDPPFGCRTEPIVHTFRELTRLCNSLTSSTHRPLPIFWIYPYYFEHYVKKEMPEMQMCDYKVNYTNHNSYSDIGSKSRKLGSPVRLFTNVPLELLQLPVTEGYKYCAKCRKYTSLENRHCNECHTCPSKNGASYIHCAFCGVCVKPTYAHCFNCRRCTKLEEHDCNEYQTNQKCRICLEKGHIERKCAKWFARFGKMKKMKGKDKVKNICLLCGKASHNERDCKCRCKFINESVFLGETDIKLKM